MKRSSLAIVLLGSLLTFGATAAWSKLPAPTEEQKAKTEASKQKAVQDVEIEKQKLEKAQDKVVQKYKQSHPNAAQDTSGSSAKDSRTQIPSAAINSRPLEKAHAYNEGVTTESARGASTGSKSGAAKVEQGSSK
jgi:hypothetical protein